MRGKASTPRGLVICFLLLSGRKVLRSAEAQGIRRAQLQGDSVRWLNSKTLNAECAQQMWRGLHDGNTCARMWPASLLSEDGGS